MRKKILIGLIKYYPIVANINLLALLVFQLFNIDLNGITGYITGCVLWPTIILVILSKDLGFCAWHRILLYNTIAYAIICLLDKLHIEFNYYIYMALIFNVLAIIVATILYVRYGCYKRMENNTGIKHNHLGRKKRTNKMFERAAADRVS